MTVLDLRIDQLRLQIDAAAGQAYRVGPIAERAMAVLAERLHERLTAADRMPRSGSIDEMRTATVRLDLKTMSDRQAADAIAATLLEALALKLGV